MGYPLFVVMSSILMTELVDGGVVVLCPDRRGGAAGSLDPPPPPLLYWLLVIPAMLKLGWRLGGMWSRSEVRQAGSCGVIYTKTKQEPK